MSRGRSLPAASPLTHQELDAVVAPAGHYLPAGGSDGEHGDGHATRVLVWANVIGNWLRRRGVRLDLHAVRWAAVLHDACRLNDGPDPEHGRRAAETIQAGGLVCLDDLSAESRVLLAYACSWHSLPDRLVPTMIPELICLKDADGLDQVRYGLLRRGSLRTPVARWLVPQARELWIESSACSRPKARALVRRHAKSAGWWADDAGADLPAVFRPADGRTC